VIVTPFDYGCDTSLAPLTIGLSTASVDYAQKGTKCASRGFGWR
jgi:hypothetical protein